MGLDNLNLDAGRFLNGLFAGVKVRALVCTRLPFCIKWTAKYQFMPGTGLNLLRKVLRPTVAFSSPGYGLVRAAGHSGQ